MQTNFKINHPFQVGFLGGLGVLTALLIGSAVMGLGSVFAYIVTAMFITLGLEPLVALLERKTGRRGYAISIVVLGLLAVIATLFTLILPPLVSQASGFVTNLPQVVSGFLKLPAVAQADVQLGGAISNALTSSTNYLSDSKNWPEMAGGLVKVGLTLFNGVIGFMTVLILTIYFMSALKSIKRIGYQLVSKSRRPKFEAIAEQVMSSVGRYVMGQVIVATINASLAFIVMTIMGVPFAIVLTFIDFLLVLVPIVGSVTSAAIITMISLATLPPSTVLVIALYFLVYMQIEAYVIAPKIMRRAVNLPGALVIVAALSGGALLGMLGALLAIPVAATIMLIVRQVWIPHQDER